MFENTCRTTEYSYNYRLCLCEGSDREDPRDGEGHHSGQEWVRRCQRGSPKRRQGPSKGRDFLAGRRGPVCGSVFRALFLRGKCVHRLLVDTFSPQLLGRNPAPFLGPESGPQEGAAWRPAASIQTGPWRWAGWVLWESGALLGMPGALRMAGCTCAVCGHEWLGGRPGLGRSMEAPGRRARGVRVVRVGRRPAGRSIRQAEATPDGVAVAWRSGVFTAQRQSNTWHCFVGVSCVLAPRRTPAGAESSIYPCDALGP